MSFRSGGSAGPMALPHVPGTPSFRASAVNAIAVIPLLSSDKYGEDDSSTFSSKSFRELLEALNRYNQANEIVTDPGEDLLLVVPNSNLTRPGDWKYDNSPLKNFHWGNGCQRLSFFDGRPYNSRMAHDRLMNHELSRNWIDICPHRRTAALIGVLNVRDCPDMATLKRAEQEWQQWAERYSTPPYEVTAHGRDFERDFVVQRLFVFDSAHESNKLDLSKSSLGSSLVAFPPSDGQHTQMMDLHMNVVVNDLAVAIFLELEGRISESDAITRGTDGQLLSSAAARSRFGVLSSKSEDKDEEGAPKGSVNLTIDNLASVVSPNSKLASPGAKNQASKKAALDEELQKVQSKESTSLAQLLTPLDDVWDYSELNPKDAQEMMRREIGRREKVAADLSLMAGSPLDAYERYMKAAELCKITCPDPLWYASALEGCAAAHIAMAEAGGFNVDEYLESSFQLPKEIMACAVSSSTEKTNKQTMSKIVFALCDDALSVLSRHPKLACFRAELLLKLAWYSAEIEDTHLRCQWGLGEGCYGGDVGSNKRRWEMSSATQLNFLDLKTKDGDDVIARNTLNRCQVWVDFMHRAVSTGELEPVTRADIALRCASMCMKGLRPTDKPTSRERSLRRTSFPRKAAFFVMSAAEAMSETDSDIPDDRAGALWVRASKLLSQTGNKGSTSNYGWATLRAAALHGLALQGLRESSEDAAVQLLSLMSEISPAKKPSIDSLGSLSSKLKALDRDSTRNIDDSETSESIADTITYQAAKSVVSSARSYVRDRVQARNTSFFSGTDVDATLLTVAQSKWVDDEPIPPIFLPMADFSEISDSIIAMRSVWSAIKLDRLSIAQRKLLRQISDLRMDMPTSSFPGSSPESSSLPIKISSAVIVEKDSQAEFERVKVKRPQKQLGAMATFFNPYANKKEEADEVTIVAEGEERYVVIKFANSLAVPLEVPRCELEFTVPQSDRIKAPAISFVIPGQTEDYPVQFPFIILKGGEESLQAEGTNIIEIKGLHLTSLARSFFLPLKGSSEKSTEQESTEQESQDAPNIPDTASLYPRRDYNGEKAKKAVCIKSPRLEIIPSQPNLTVSCAASPTPVEASTIIPAPLADGEIFKLPKLYLKNNVGIIGLSKIEQLQITAIGLPGRSEVVLFDLSGAPVADTTRKKMGEATPLELTAEWNGIDGNTLNDERKGTGTISLLLTATTDMGVHFKEATVRIRFRYRGKIRSAGEEFWRKREIQIRVMRIKGPRISSLTFRQDLSWESAYSALCKVLAHQDRHNGDRPSGISELDPPPAGSSDSQEFVANRLGKDPGVHVCGENIVALLSVANETFSSIILSRPNSIVGGFHVSPLETIRVPAGVSAKIPMILSRIDRAPEICEQLTSMTSLEWTSEIPQGESELSIETGGTMVPPNRRVRNGKIEIPAACLKSIIDENPTFLSRICKSPCSIHVGVHDLSGNKEVRVALGKPADTSVEIELADWVPESVWEKSNLTLKFCCARKDGSDYRDEDQCDYVWCGQIQKAIPSSIENKNQSHRARIIFLRKGDYVVSACVSFRRTDVDDDVNETWWAEKAQDVHVQDFPLGQ